MEINPNIIETSRNIDALILVAKTRPTADIRDKLIDLEIDYNGRWVGFDAANYIWNKLIQEAA